MARRGKDDIEAIRITTASTSREKDIAARQQRYLWSMSLRSACFVGAVIAALSGVDWLWPFLIAGAIILPYVAVVMANAAANLTDGFKLREADFNLRELQQGRDRYSEL